MALDGREERIKQYAETLTKGYLRINKKKKQCSLSLIRYDDDFVIMYKDIDVILTSQNIIADWLSDIG